MSKDGKWWDKSITLVEGCTPISDGCKNCWSAGMGHRFHGKKGLTTDGHYNGKIICRADRIKELGRGEPKRWVIWNDLFHPQVPFEFIDKVFAIMALCPQHTFLILTKRPDIMKKYMLTKHRWKNHVLLEAEKIHSAWQTPLKYHWPQSHIHLGVTVCTPDELPKINILRTIPAAHRFVCFEPLLHYMGKLNLEGIDWVIVGCESLGSRAGRFQDGYDEAALDIIRQCEAAGVLVWHKQRPDNGKVSKDMNKWKPEFRVRAKDGNAYPQRN